MIWIVTSLYAISRPLGEMQFEIMKPIPTVERYNAKRGDRDGGLDHSDYKEKENARYMAFDSRHVSEF